MKYETEGLEKATQWLSHLYPTLSYKRKNNPDVIRLRMAKKCLIKIGFRLFCEAYQPSEMPQRINEGG